MAKAILELRAHAVYAADEDGLAVFLEVEREEPAEAADFTSTSRRCVRCEQVLRCVALYLFAENLCQRSAAA